MSGRLIFRPPARHLYRRPCGARAVATRWPRPPPPGLFPPHHPVPAQEKGLLILVEPAAFEERLRRLDVAAPVTAHRLGGGRGESAARELAVAALAILREQRRRDACWEDLVIAWLDIALLTLRRYGVMQPIGSRSARSRIAEVVAFLDDHLTDPPGLAQLASDFAMSESHLAHLFRHEMGVSVLEHIHRQRIRRACVLLLRTQMSVLEISLETGYGSLSFFNRTFRRIVGEPPRAYRTRRG